MNFVKTRGEDFKNFGTKTNLPLNAIFHELFEVCFVVAF